MAFNGSGTFARLYNWVNDRDSAIKILASRMDAEMDGFATGLSTCILKDGTQTVTANIPMATYKFTGLGAGTGAGDSVRYEQVGLLAASNVFTGSGVVQTFRNTSDSASVQVAIFEGDRATMADSDEAYISLKLSDDAGTQKEISRLTWVATDVNAGTNVDGRLDFSAMVAGTITKLISMSSAGFFYPTTNDGMALGLSGNAFSDIFLASGAVINFNAGNYTITHSAGNLAFSGAITLGTALAVAQGGTASTTAAAGARTLLDGLGTTKGNILWYNTSWTVLAPP